MRSRYYKFVLSFLLSWIALLTYAQDSISAQWFREWYHRSDLIYYLEALNDHSIVETPTYGQWWIPDRLSIAIEGLPCTSNRYYIDGMRADDRFQPGSTRFISNMQRYNLQMNVRTAQLYLSLDTLVGDYVQIYSNFGQIGNGEPALGTTEILNLMHPSPMQSADRWKHITARRHQLGAGSLDGAYTFHDQQGNAYRQHLYAVYGQRVITRENQEGLITDCPYYNAEYYTIQADGYLPMRPNKVFRKLGYRFNFSSRTDGGSEYLYNANEVYQLRNYTGTLYAKREFLTTGLTWATNTIRHDDVSFSKNLIDQDGESFAPWVADGNTHELSWAVQYKQPVLPWLNVHIDAYNSLILFRPTISTFTNAVYMQAPLAITPTDMYQYEWTSQGFTGGILENTLGLDAQYSVCSQLDIKSHLDFTLDGLLLRHKSKVTPYFQAGLSLNVHPCYWFDMQLDLDYERMPYTEDYLRYFSDDYMNANVYQVSSHTLLATTGGKYHTCGDKLWQPSYLNINLPIRFRFGEGRHEIVLQQSYRKFFNVWHTYYASPIEEYGFYQQQGGVDVYYLNSGEKYYEVAACPVAGDGWFQNSPYYLSQLTRYTYKGRKFMFSLSWQSVLSAGFVGLGNGANSNSIGVLSESTANPNIQNVLTNQGAKYAGVGRVDLDKGFVCRIYWAYNICKWVQVGMTMKWTDGKPFTAYQYYMDHQQVAILPMSSRGTNPTDQNFGRRHCAKYNVDLHVQGHWMAGRVPMRLSVECYNMWDFCHDLAEMAFIQDIPQADRSSMIMDIPTGLLATMTIELP